MTNTIRNDSNTSARHTELFHVIKERLVQNGDYERIRQRFLAELMLNPSANNNNNSSNTRNTWINTIEDGLRQREDNTNNPSCRRENNNNNSVESNTTAAPTFEEIATKVHTIGKASVPIEVETKIIKIIEAAIKKQQQR